MAEGARLESVYTVTYRGFDSLSHRQIKAKGISILLVPFVVLGHFWGRISVFQSVQVLVWPNHFRDAVSHSLRVFGDPFTVVLFDHSGVTMTKLARYPLKRNVV